MEMTSHGHDGLYPSPPSLHASSSPLNNASPSVYHLQDDFVRHQRHLQMEGHGRELVPVHHPQDPREHSTTCVPSLIPPGIDPAQVDVRTFYPSVIPIHAACAAHSDPSCPCCRYQPNEVKHRKRTTRPQLKVLEDVYTRDKKPNAGLRKKLADELGMTPRGVQVRHREHEPCAQT
jgi:hypothetical protein